MVVNNALRKDRIDVRKQGHCKAVRFLDIE